jgi:hypothetical protein
MRIASLKRKLAILDFYKFLPVFKETQFSRFRLILKSYKIWIKWNISKTIALKNY